MRHAQRHRSCFSSMGAASWNVSLRPCRCVTRSSAQGNCSAKSLEASVMSSILPCSPILPCPPCLPLIMLSVGGCVLPLVGGGVCLWQGEGGPMGRGGQGTFQSSCHCTTTWCFAPKGLRTMRQWMLHTYAKCRALLSIRFRLSWVCVKRDGQPETELFQKAGGGIVPPHPKDT